MANSRKSEIKRNWCNNSEFKQQEINEIFDKWHCNLGRPNATIIKHVLNKNNIFFMDISLPYICIYCQVGKSHKLPFLDSETQYNKPLESIVVDLWGPVPIYTDHGYKYYISFVDAFSRYVDIFFKIKV